MNSVIQLGKLLKIAVILIAKVIQRPLHILISCKSPVIEDFFFEAQHLCPWIWLHQSICQRKNVITDEVVMDLSNFGWKIELIFFKCFFQVTSLGHKFYQK